MTAIDVVVATCGRPRELAACLDSLLAQTYPANSIVVVDDAPGGDLTPAVVTRFADRAPVRYVAGRRGGLADAHNRGLEHVRAPLVAFTDDDVIADPRWLEGLVTGFASEQDVACVTGKIVPCELANDVQALLDGFAGFDKGCVRRVYDLQAHLPDDPLYPFAAGRFGSGANMAFTRSVLVEAGGFDPALGAGTRARGGDDLAAFFEVVQRGHRLVYQPSAVVRHRHAEDVLALKRQVYGYGVGLTAYLTKCLLDRPWLLLSAVRRLPAAVRYVTAPDSSKNARLPRGYPPRLTRLERIGMLTGPFAYLASRWQVSRQR
jgi:GT2 family glycosyltransferase